MCSFIIHQEFEFEMFFLEFGRSRVVRNREITGIATLYFFVIRISSLLLLLLQWSLNLLHRGPPINEKPPCESGQHYMVSAPRIYGNYLALAL